MVGPVAVVLAVAEVVLHVERRQVGEGEAVVRRHEVEARERPPLDREGVRRTGQPGGEAADAAAGHAGLALTTQVSEPEVAHAVAVAVVPLREAGREVAGLPTVGAHVPRFGDELRRREDRVLEHRPQQRMLGGVAAVVVAPERGREVEAEAVDLQLLGEVPHRVEDEALRRRMAEVEGVAAAGRVDVAAVRVVAVVGRVVDAAERVRRALAALLGRVVVDHVEHHLEAGLVQAPHHAGELATHGVRPLGLSGRRGVGRVRREERERVVAPVVEAPLPHQALLGHERVHREELDGGDPEAGEVLQRGVVGEPGIGAAEGLGDRAVELREAAHVRLVDDRVVERDARLRSARPVESVVGERGERDAAPGAVGRARDPARVRVEQGVHRVERVVEAGRTVDPESVARTGHQRGREALPDAVGIAHERRALDRPVEVAVGEHLEVDRGRMLGPDPDAAAVSAAPDAETVHGIGRGHAIYSSS